MTDDTERLVFALLATALWLVLVLITAGGVLKNRHVARQLARHRTDILTAGPAGATLVVFASQTGQAESLAAMSADILTRAGWPVHVMSMAELDRQSLVCASRIIFVVSTTGEGDPPDSAGRLVRTLFDETPELDRLAYALLSLGDKSYQDFCGFGRSLEDWLVRCRARALFDTVEVDDMDPAAISQWQSHLTRLTGQAVTPDWSPGTYLPWRLVKRQHLNPGSPGGEAFHLGLEPLGHRPLWVAGDIAEISLADPGDPATTRPQVRAYSIASLPSDGRVELVVRLVHRPDQTPGLGSGFLTRTLAEGGQVSMRIRTNSGFHGPPASVPLILIGNGTGIAGLRAHLRARCVREGGTWLMFGERTFAHDAFFETELSDALACGSLDRLDRAFSRDGDQQNRTGRYVQDLVDLNAGEIGAWVRRGAAIYVCGSRDGMASGVDAALLQALGEQTLTALADAGRYRRDVY